MIHEIESTMNTSMHIVKLMNNMHDRYSLFFKESNKLYKFLYFDSNITRHYLIRMMKSNFV